MKIIHIIYDSIGNPWLNGGGAQRTHQIYKRLSGQHEITVFTGNFSNSQTYIDGIRYKRIGIPFNYLISRLSFLFLISFYILFSKADLFIEDLGFPFPLLITILKKNYFASVQFIPNKSYIKKRKIIGLLVFHLYRIGIRFYKKFITISKYSKNEIIEMNPEANTYIIPNGINKLNKISKLGSYFLYLGRIDTVEKGLDTLIKSINDLVKEKIFIKLIIAGSGELSESIKLKKLINDYKLSDQISLIGYVQGKNKIQILKNAFCLVIPSRNEILPLCVLEAFSYGKPVIASNVGGLTELIKNSQGGQLVSPGNHKELSNRIKYLYQNRKIAEKIGNNGYVFVRNYTWNKISKNFNNLLEKSKNINND